VQLSAGSIANLQIGRPACFTPDGTRLIATGSGATALYVWDLRLIRQQLKELGLDWDWPEFAPEAGGSRHPARRPASGGSRSPLGGPPPVVRVVGAELLEGKEKKA
jgi:hypothetical protein